MDDNAIAWKPLSRQWPGNVRLRHDPGDIASLDCGTRSRTTLEIEANRARFSCAHARVTVGVETGAKPPFTDKGLTRLVLYLAYLGITCDCFRARWRYLDRGKFCRAAAIETWRWLERTIGWPNVSPMWFRRIPEGLSFQGRGEAVNDGLFPGQKGGVARFPSGAARGGRRHLSSSEGRRQEASNGQGRYPVVSLEEFLATDE